MIHRYFQEGRKAYIELGHLAKNPYSEGTAPHDSWNNGFDHEWFSEVDLDELRY